MKAARQDIAPTGIAIISTKRSTYLQYAPIKIEELGILAWEGGDFSELMAIGQTDEPKAYLNDYKKGGES